MPVRLVELTRSGLMESVHTGSIAIVDSGGTVKYELGDINRLTFFHSSAKPVQAVAALEAGAAEKFGLNLGEIAIIMSSHSGEKEHIDVLREIIGKMGIEEDDIVCGIADPISKDALRELHNAGLKPSNLHCNCSGKHLGFIAAAKMNGYDAVDYFNPGHPVQKLVKDIVADFSGVESSSIGSATDGCGVPVFALPLKNMAQAYANLCNPDFMDGKYKKSQNYIMSALTMFPEMVAGKGRLDTELMKRFGSRVIIKSGAEGVCCIGIAGRGTGIAVKIDDGALRAVGPVAVEVLVQLGLLDIEEALQLKEFWKPDLLNNKGEKVGDIRAVFDIRSNDIGLR